MEDVNKGQRIFLSLSRLECVTQETTSEKVATFDIFSELELTRQSFKKREFIRGLCRGVLKTI